MGRPLAAQRHLLTASGVCGRTAGHSFGRSLREDSPCRAGARASSWRAVGANISMWGPQAARFTQALDADLLALVETRVGATGVPKLKKELARMGWQCFAAPAAATASDFSAGTAVLCRRGLQTTGVTVDPGGRFSAVRVNLHDTSIVVAAVYLWTGEGPTERNVAVLRRLGEILSQQDRPAILFGDWNMAPSVLQETGFLAECKAEVVWQPQIASTMVGGSGYLDFFVVSSRLLPAVRPEGQVPAPFRPHIALGLRCAARPRDIRVRKLCQPKQFTGAGVPPCSDSCWQDALAAAMCDEQDASSYVNGVPSVFGAEYDSLAADLAGQLRSTVAAAERVMAEADAIPENVRHKYYGRCRQLSFRQAPLLDKRPKLAMEQEVADLWGKVSSLLDRLVDTRKMLLTAVPG